MKNYVWLNPVVETSYNLKKLKSILLSKDFEVVNPLLDNANIVLGKYREYVLKANKTVVDARCPMIIEHFKKHEFIVDYPDIEPILIHVARELADRKDLKDGKKYILTPCKSLKEYGINLNLDNTYFYTWDEFVLSNNIEIQGETSHESPVPLGFFDSFETKILKVSSHNINQITQSIIDEFKFVEGLYCNKGCNNGDGVTSIG